MPTEIMHTCLLVICAWCGKQIGTKDGKGQTGITHGICPDCAKSAIIGDPEEEAKIQTLNEWRGEIQRRSYEGYNIHDMSLGYTLTGCPKCYPS